MKKTLSLLAGLALVACTAAPAPAPLGPQPTDPVGPRLSAAELQSAIVGNTGAGPRTGTLSTWSMYVAPDGRLAGKGATMTDTGTWRITGDGQFCMQWKVDFDGLPICATAHRTGSAIQFAAPDVRTVMTFTPGNRL